MAYALGVDLGTTFTAAATFRGGRVEIASMGNRSAAVPSVVLLRQDEEVLTGEAANRRGATEPDRVAREFKRRVGDTTPIFLGGSPYSAEALMAKLLRWVVHEVSTREGGPPDHLAVSHPANWGQYKKDLLAQAVRLADLSEATYLTEPEAAAIHYASQERVEAGEVVAVYDLGGGTFDAAVLRKKREGGFEILGEPEGIERLGGIDFDAAVFAHIARSLEGKLEELDEDDETALAAVARLRQEAVDAKEALSSDTDATIPVLLPNVQTEVRLTRTEFEGMIRPALSDSIEAMRRALRSAKVEPDEVSTVLLVGGSSRIPLVSQLVGAELGRPVAVDTHPKHSVALGAALAAAQAGGMAGAVEEVAADPGDDDARGADAKGAGVGAAAGAAVGAAAAGAAMAGDPAHAAEAAGQPISAVEPPTQPVTPVDVPTEPAATYAPPQPSTPTSEVPAGVGAPTAATPTAAGYQEPPPGAGGYLPPGAGEAPPVSEAADDGDGKDGGGIPWLPILGVIVFLALLGGGIAFALSSGGGDEDEGGGGEEAAVDEDVSMRFTDVTLDTDSGRFIADFETEGFTPSEDEDDLQNPDEFHVGFFFDTTDPEGDVVHFTGSGPYESPDNWTAQDAIDQGASQLCAAVFQGGDPPELVDASGECVDITDVLDQFLASQNQGNNQNQNNGGNNNNNGATTTAPPTTAPPTTAPPTTA